MQTPSVGLTNAHADILPILEENKRGDRELRFGIGSFFGKFPKIAGRLCTSARSPDPPAPAFRRGDADFPRAGARLHSCFFDPGGEGFRGGATQSLEGPFSAVSKPIF